MSNRPEEDVNPLPTTLEREWAKKAILSQAANVDLEELSAIYDKFIESRRLIRDQVAQLQPPESRLAKIWRKYQIDRNAKRQAQNAARQAAKEAAEREQVWRQSLRQRNKDLITEHLNRFDNTGVLALFHDTRDALQEQGFRDAHIKIWTPDLEATKFKSPRIQLAWNIRLRQGLGNYFSGYDYVWMMRMLEMHFNDSYEVCIGNGDGKSVRKSEQKSPVEDAAALINLGLNGYTSFWGSLCSYRAVAYRDYQPPLHLMPRILYNSIFKD